MDRFTGYYRRIKSNNDDQLAIAEAETLLQTRTGINRMTGTVQESILYSRQVFKEHTRFWGDLHVEDYLAPNLQQFLNDAHLSGFVRIGTGRSRGMGKVHLSFKQVDKTQHNGFEIFKQRVEEFDTKLHDQVKDAFGPLNLKPLYFAVTLHSPVIIYDELLRYQGVIDNKMLGEMLGLPSETLKLEYQNASVRQILGWNELWGMPRTKEVAIDTGSVFLFSTTLGEGEALEKLLKALFVLEQVGVGRRKAEGFGRICVSDQFHKEVALR